MLTVQQFEQYDKANPEIYRRFLQFAMQAVNAGRKRIGAKAIWERLRWESMVRGNDMFKLNNNYTAFYVRKLEKDVPFMRGFFRTRTSTADERTLMQNVLS